MKNLFQAIKPLIVFMHLLLLMDDYKSFQIEFENFKKSDKKNAENKNEEKEKVKKKERKSGSGSGASSAELNINIWPFSRSRSAGNAGTRPKLFAGAPVTRKVNSAPCSRSNSAGESKSRKG